MKIAIVTFTLSIKGEKKDFGGGAGIIKKRIVEYKDPQDRGFDSAMFAMEMIRASTSLMEDTVEVSYDVKIKTTGKKRKKK